MPSPRPSGGGPAPANGLGAVLKAAAELKRRNVNGLKFIFIGEGMEKKPLMDMTREYGLEDMVCWVDPIAKDELARLLPRMDAGLMILKNLEMYYYGSSPNKFFDYISLGLPVINNYPGWLAEIITQNQCGIVVPEDNLEAFADSLIKLKDQPNLLEKMSKNSRKLAETGFDRNRIGEKFVDVLESVAVL